MNWDCVSYWIEHHPGLASWVQALGSIAAIFAAIWVASSQARNQLKREKREAGEKSLAHAGRLYLIVKEFCDMLDVVKTVHDDASGMADQSVSVAFGRIISRVNSNFDDDLNPARNVQVHILRAALTSLIFVLDNARHLNSDERATEIIRLKKLAPDLLKSCAALVESAK